MSAGHSQIRWGGKWRWWWWPDQWRSPRQQNTGISGKKTLYTAELLFFFKVRYHYFCFLFNHIILLYFY